jgi:hypothetical protein
VVVTNLWRTGFRSVLAVVVAGALVATASYSGGDDRSAPPEAAANTVVTRRPSTTSTTTGAADAVRAEVERAYRASSEAFIDAAAVPDPNWPALAATHTGAMLEQRRNVLLAMQADGVVIRYPTPTQYRAEVDDIELTDDRATLEVCTVDDGESVVVATGEVVAGGLVSVAARAALRRVDGSWRLEAREQLGKWEGVAGCASD